jgi:hypothetical protein
MNATLPGFSNLIVRGATSAYEVQSSNKGTITIGQNLQDTILSTSVINEIVPSLVMMEFILENKLSQNIHGSVGELNGLNIPFTGPTDLVKLDGFNNDSHNTGSLATLFYFTKYYQAVGACLLAFTQHLKKIGQFDKSIIFINSEFNRSARNDGSGSDHGWDGSNFSLLSGAIDGLKVIGSVKKDTYGVSHPVVELANRDMSIGNVHSSLAAILKVKSPTPNDQSFLGLKDNKVVTFIGKKNV